MKSTKLLHQAKARLDNLSPRHLKTADEFLAYLQERESTEATAELLAIPGLLDRLQESEEAIMLDGLTPVDDLLRAEA